MTVGELRYILDKLCEEREDVADCPVAIMVEMKHFAYPEIGDVGTSKVTGRKALVIDLVSGR